MNYLIFGLIVAAAVVVLLYKRGIIKLPVLNKGTDVPKPVAPKATNVADSQTIIPNTTQRVSNVTDAFLRSGAGYGRDGQGYGAQHASVDFRGSVIPWEQNGTYRYQPAKAGQPVIFSFSAPSQSHVTLSIPFGPFTGSQAKWIAATLDAGPEERIMVGTVAGTIQREVSPGTHVLSLTADGDIPELRVQMAH